jgi:hypothetical protein
LLVRMAEITWTFRAEARSVCRQVRELSSNRVRERVRECTGRRARSHSAGHSAVWSSMLGFLMIAAAMAGIPVFV